MNTRTVSKTITWKLELTPEEDRLFRRILDEITKFLGDDETYALAEKLLTLIPKGGTDETTGPDDVDSDRSLDDFERRSAIHDATMGIPTDAATRLSKLADTCRGGCKPSEPEDFDCAARRSSVAEWNKARG